MAKRILVVQYQLEVAALLFCLFGEAGYEVSIVGQTSKLSDQIKENPPDLFCIEALLPNDEGLSLALRIRTGEFGSRTSEKPIILLDSLSLLSERVFSVSSVIFYRRKFNPPLLFFFNTKIFSDLIQPLQMLDVDRRRCKS